MKKLVTAALVLVALVSGCDTKKVYVFNPVVHDTTTVAPADTSCGKKPVCHRKHCK